MQRPVYYAFICSLMLGFGCSNTGQRETKKVVPTVPLPGPNNQKPNSGSGSSNGSGVGLGLIHSSDVQTSHCSSYDREPRVEVMAADAFIFDGALDEWNGKPLSVLDANDVTQNDIRYSSIAYENEQKDALIGAIKLVNPKLSHGSALLLEFGILNETADSQQILQSSRIYRLGDDAVSELVGNEWRAVEDRVISYKLDQRGGLEWRIERRQVDAVLGKALWWMRVLTTNPSGYDDVSSLAFFKSEDPARRDEFSISVCRSDSFDKQPMRFYQIAQKGVDPSDAEAIFDVMRSPYEDLHSQMNYRPLALMSFANIITNKPLRYDVKLQGFDDMGFNYADHIQMDDDLKRHIKSSDLLQVYEANLEAFSTALMHSIRPSDPDSPAFAFLAASYAVQKRRGLNGWLSYLNAPSDRFLKTADVASPVSLHERMDRLGEAFGSADEEASYRRETNDKMKAWSQLAGNKLSARLAFDAWFATDQEAKSYLKKIYAEPSFIDSLWSGWLEAGAYMGDAVPGLLYDADADGLPLFLEAFYSTDPMKADTDGDNWSDLAEVLVGKKPLSRTSAPTALLADNVFADWQELLPTKIKVHGGKLANSSCPESAKINAYAAIANKEGIQIGLKMEAALMPQAQQSWELSFDGTEELKQRVLRLMGHGYGAKVYDVDSGALRSVLDSSLRNSGDSFDWFIPRRALGLSELDLKKNISIKITTIHEVGRRDQCDTVPWFSPLR